MSSIKCFSKVSGLKSSPLSKLLSIQARSSSSVIHTDLPTPDFSAYRKKGSDPTKKNESMVSGRNFLYVMSGASCAVGVYGGKSIVQSFISYMSAPAYVLAMAAIEINLADIPEGQGAVFKWRGKPVFIRHRTQNEINTERSVNVSTLRDPQTDEDRVVDSKWLVVLGVCTHLGCVPIANAGEFGGYFCPCHGSHYDASGRIRKGPAPLNLEVPSHEFLPGNILKVG